MAPASDACTLSVVIPMYNEAGKLEPNLRTFLDALGKLDCSWELIVVNDGSTDNSLQIAQTVCNDHPQVSVVSYTRNRGRGYALRQGFQRARGTYVVTTESDFSWGPDIVEKLYHALLEKDCDAVIASPYLKGGKLENVPLHRRLLSVGGNQIMRRAFGHNLTMLSGMTRGYRRECLQDLCLISDGKEIHLEIASKLLALGYSVVEIAAVLRWEPPTQKQPARKSSFKALPLVASHLLYSFNESPLIFLGLLGLGFLLPGCVLAAVALYLKLTEGLSGYAFLPFYVVLLTTVGLILVTLALLGNLLREQFKEMLRLRASCSSLLRLAEEQAMEIKQLSVGAARHHQVISSLLGQVPEAEKQSDRNGEERVSDHKG